MMKLKFLITFVVFNCILKIFYIIHFFDSFSGFHLVGVDSVRLESHQDSGLKISQDRGLLNEDLSGVTTDGQNMNLSQSDLDSNLDGSDKNLYKSLLDSSQAFIGAGNLNPVTHTGLNNYPQKQSELSDFSMENLKDNKDTYMTDSLLTKNIYSNNRSKLEASSKSSAHSSGVSSISNAPMKNKIKIGINGFGRIGRLLLRATLDADDAEVKHINCSMDPEYMKYLLSFDSAHGSLKHDISCTNGSLIINGNEISISNTRNPADIPWKKANVDYVCESTGVFCSTEAAKEHINRADGCKRVVISAPAKDEETPTFVYGVNSDEYKNDMYVISCASCTTNALAPIVKVLDDNFGFDEGLMTTIHAATNTQKVVDSNSKKDWRGGRSALVNIIPSSTGAAKAVAKCMPSMKGKLTGMAFRVPTIDVSVVDLTCKLKKKCSYDDIKDAMKKAATSAMKGILDYVDTMVVSQDFIGNRHSSIFDAKAGIMLNDNFFKIISWYDNEVGYANRILDMFRVMMDKENK